METTLVSVEKSFATPFEIAQRYYALLSTLVPLELTPREIQLIAFTAVRGTLSGSGRTQFIQLVGTTKAFLANMIHELFQEGILLKEKRRIKLHPSLQQDFSRSLHLHIQLHVTERTTD